jgi:peroxiredoxin Q/BCP
MGVDRSTFLVNEKGNIVKEWRSVKVKGHVDDVINEIEKL